MTLKDNKVFKHAVVLIAVVVVTGAIGAVLSARVGQRGPDGQMGPGGPPMGGPGRMGGPHGGPMGGFGMMGPGLRELDLTDAQREQMRGIFESYREKFKAIGAKMAPARNALQDAVAGGIENAAAIQDAAADVAAVELEAALLNATVQGEVFKMLTAEQQQKAKALRNEMRERMKEGRNRSRQQIDRRLEQKRGRPQAV